MRFRFFIYLALVLVSLGRFSQPAFAHLAGQPPSFKIDGVYTNNYPIPAVSVQDLVLPQDIAPKPYLVNQTLTFDIDTTRLSIPADIIKNLAFVWDFGDGAKGSGIENVHSYSKIGSYFLTVNAIAPNDPTNYLIQSILINIVPSENYVLPQAVIAVNGKTVTNPQDIIKQNLNSVSFDGSESKSSSQVVSYTWDFGDISSGNGQNITHNYAKNKYTVSPVLRIKTADGFMADTYAQLLNDSDSSANFLPYLLIGVGLIFIIVLIVLIKSYLVPKKP